MNNTIQSRLDKLLEATGEPIIAFCSAMAAIGVNRRQLMLFLLSRLDVVTVEIAKKAGINNPADCIHRLIEEGVQIKKSYAIGNVPRSQDYVQYTLCEEAQESPLQEVS